MRPRAHRKTFPFGRWAGASFFERAQRSAERPALFALDFPKLFDAWGRKFPSRVRDAAGALALV